MSAAGWAFAGLLALLLWRAPEAVFLLFGGLLLGVLLDTLALHVRRATGWPPMWSLGVVVVVIAGLLGWGAWSGGVGFVREVDDFGRTLVRQARELEGQLARAGLDPAALVDPAARASEETPRPTLLGLLLPDPQALTRQAGAAFGALFGFLGNVVLVVFTGLFVAADLRGLRRAAVRLARPSRRARVAGAVRAALETLRWWLVGQGVTMAAIALSLWLALALLGVPGAFLLGLQAGLVNFVPYLGPVVSIVPVTLSAAPLGAGTLAWSAAAFLLIQTLEGYVLTPLVQRRAVDLHPVATLAGLVVFGALFGAAGVALSTPILAAGLVMARHLSREPAARPAS
ncbi:AI-2E family transporter [Alsobacter sp. R-9]